MSKIVLNNITSGHAATTLINANNDLVEAAIENTLSRDGSTPNTMQANLDMNGFQILNQLAVSGETNFTWKGTWTISTAYTRNNLVYVPSGSYQGYGMICTVAHTSSSVDFDSDGPLTNWAIFVQRGAAGAGTGDMLKSENLSGLTNYTTARSNLGLGTAAVIADNTLVHLAGTETITGDKTFSGNNSYNLAIGRMAQAKRAAADSISSQAGYTSGTLDTEELSETGYTYSTSGITIATAGKYLMTVNALFATTTTGQFGVAGVIVSGTLTNGRIPFLEPSLAATTVTYSQLQSSSVIEVAAGTKVNVKVRQITGGAVDITYGLQLVRLS